MIIAAANKKVKQVLDKADKPEGNSKHGEYEHFTPEEKAQIGKQAAEYGVTASLRYLVTPIHECRCIKVFSTKSYFSPIRQIW